MTNIFFANLTAEALAMDIKSAPIISSPAAAPKENTNPAFLATASLPEFLIRTMKQDLTLAPLSGALAGTPSELKIQMPQAPARPSIESELKKAEKNKKEEEGKKSAEAASIKKQRQKEFAQIFEIAKLKIEKGGFEEAKEELKKILKAPEAGWWLKWRTKSLLKKAEERAKKPQIKIAAPVKPVLPQIKFEPKKVEKSKEEPLKPTSLPAPLPSVPRITAAPPVGLPVAEAPAPQPKPEIKIPPVPPPPIEISKPAVSPPPPITPVKPPIKPLVPVGALPLKKPVPKPFPAKLVFGTLIFILIFTLIGGLFYLFNRPAQPGGTPIPTFFQTPLPFQTPSVTPTPSPQIVATPLFAMEEKTIIEFETEEKNLFEVLQNSQILNKTTDSFTQIFVRENGKGDKLMDLPEIAALFFPELLNLKNENSSLGNLINADSAGNFTLFAFWEEQKDSSPFNPTLNQPRPGLAIKLTGLNTSQKTEWENILKKSEPNLPSVLKNFLPQNTKTDSRVAFSVNVYRDISLRYFNFLPDASLSIDYALIDNLILITTSRQSAYAAVDLILEKGAPAQR